MENQIISPVYTSAIYNFVLPDGQERPNPGCQKSGLKARSTALCSSTDRMTMAESS
jgi:hypothetical protein